MDDINQSANFQQPPISQPVEQSVQQPVQKDKNIFKYLFFILLILFLGIIIAGYFLLTKKINTLSQSASIPTQTNTVSEITSTPTVATTVTSTESKESTLTEIDDEWNLYTNYKYGFTLKVPKKASFPNCNYSDWTQEPITFFENQDTIWFANQYFYETIGTSCVRQETKITNLDSSYVNTLPIYISNVNNDEELEQFIKSKFGSGCSLGEKTQLDDKEIFDVSILGDGKDLGETECPINYIIIRRYNASKKIFMAFLLGQSCAFEGENNICYTLYDSLEFF